MQDSLMNFLRDTRDKRVKDLSKGALVKGTFKKYRDNEKSINEKYRKKIVEKISKIVQKSSKNCDTKIFLSYFNDPVKLRECVGRKRKIFEPRYYDGDYIVLKNENECTMSIMTLENDPDWSYIDISSETVENQVRKRYNTLLRTIAFMCAYVEKRPLLSFALNPISAYTLVKMFATKIRVDKTDRELVFSKPLSANRAENLIDDILEDDFKNKVEKFMVQISINKHEGNLKRAIEMFFRGVNSLECFENH